MSAASADNAVKKTGRPETRGHQCDLLSLLIDARAPLCFALALIEIAASPRANLFFARGGAKQWRGATAASK